MIKFREINYQQDIDEIISLLNRNFETMHSRKSFLWKHYENPFGLSYGLLALDNGRIIGLRMFMRWEFICKNKVIRAIRPVDTCTDRDFRGKGLFKKLTLQGLENIKDEYDFIFNTPNEKSQPGYIKMGWKRIPGDHIYKLGIVNILKKPEKYKNITANEIDFKESWLNSLDYQTRVSKKFLEWRFKDSDYSLAKFHDGGVVVYKIKRIKKIKLFIVVDFFGDLGECGKKVSSICKKNGAILIYYLNSEKSKYLNIPFGISRFFQTVVYKDDRYGIGEKIKFSIGDLEGRL